MENIDINVTFDDASSPTSESVSESASFANGPGVRGGASFSLFMMLVRLLGGGGRGGLRFKVCSSSVVSTVEMSEDDNVESSDEDSFEMEGSG